MPVAAVAGQARRLDAEYGADEATAYRRDELLKSRPLHESGPGAPQIVIDRDDRCEAHFASGFGERVLATLAFGVLRDLSHARLPDVYRGATGEVLRPNFRIHHELAFRGLLLCRLVPRVLSARVRLGPSPPRRVRPVPVAALVRPLPRRPGPARVVFLMLVCVDSSDLSSSSKEFNGPTADGAAARPVSTLRSSFNASILTCGAPRDIAAHIEASSIHAGSSRHRPRRTSTCATSLPRRPVRRINGTVLPCSGCQGYSMTTEFNRYVECCLMPPPSRNTALCRHRASHRRLDRAADYRSRCRSRRSPIPCPRPG